MNTKSNKKFIQFPNEYNEEVLEHFNFLDNIIENDNSNTNIIKSDYAVLLKKKICPSCKRTGAKLQIVKSNQGIYFCTISCFHHSCELGKKSKGFYTFIKERNLEFEFNKAKKLKKLNYIPEITRVSTNKFEKISNYDELNKSILEKINIAFGTHRQYLKDFYSLEEETELSLRARKYLQDKLNIIDNCRYKYFFVTDNYKNPFFNRIIYTTFDKDGDIMFFQGRWLEGDYGIDKNNTHFSHKRKYYNFPGEVFTSNVDFVDKTKEIIILESFPDAQFFENSIGMGSLNISSNFRKEIIDKDIKNLYFIYDNDFGKEINTGLERAKEVIKAGYYAFNWRYFFTLFDIKGNERINFKDGEHLLKFFKKTFNENLEVIEFDMIKYFFTNKIENL